MKVYLKPFFGKVFLENRIFEVDNGHNVFMGFRKRMRTLGVDLQTIDKWKSGPADWIVFCDTPYPWEIGSWLKLFWNRGNRILFNFESPLVNPFSQMKFVGRLYDKIYTWNDDLIDGKKYFKFVIPQVSNEREKDVEFEKKTLLVNVSSKRRSPSLFGLFSKHKSNGYKKRLSLVRYFERYEPDLLHFYGRGWEGTEIEKYNVFKGEIKGNGKLEVVSKYKFGVCFENASAPGYITEKIIDCFKAGCVPIYWGAPNISDYIPKKCFVDYREFESDVELVDFITKMDKKTFEGYVQSARKLMKSKVFQQRWFERGFEKTFLTAISFDG